MVSSGVQVVILCEDQQAQVFIRRALVHSGVKKRRIYCRPLPSDEDGGAGDAFVTKKYAGEVRVLRSKAGSVVTGLAVHLDADENTVRARHDSLAKSLTEAGQDERKDGERIAELVPKRNIETWIYALDDRFRSGLGAEIGEARSYAKLGKPGGCASAACTFSTHASKGTRPDVSQNVPSILDGLKEFGRLIQTLR
jgi:hypothetical protein